MIDEVLEPAWAGEIWGRLLFLDDEKAGRFARGGFSEADLDIDAARGDFSFAGLAVLAFARPVGRHQDFDLACLGRRVENLALVSAGGHKELLQTGESDFFGKGRIDDRSAAIGGKPFDPGDGVLLVLGAMNGDAVFEFCE